MVELNNDVIKWLAEQRSRVEQMLKICESQEDRERTFNDLMEMAGQFLDLAKQLVAMSHAAANAATSVRGDPSPTEVSSANDV
jgi:hypothetical protein